MARFTAVPLYPVSLNLKGVPVLVVGGGGVAARKLAGLLEAQAAVTAVAPEFQPEFNAVAKRRVKRLRRKFRSGDLKNPRLVFAATDNAALNARIAQACRRRGILVNAATSPEAGDMQVPASVRHGQFCIAVSTGGASAALAAQWRKLEKLAGPEWGHLAELLNQRRQRVMVEIADPERRRHVLERLGRAEWARQIKRHGVKYAARKMDRWLTQYGKQQRGKH